MTLICVKICGQKERNDGTDDTSFAEAVRMSTVADPTSNPGPFRDGQYSGSAYARFDRHYDAINPSNVEPVA